MKNMREYILSLDGPPCSYCVCSKICTVAQIDHVVPKFLLKRKILDKELLKQAMRDPHNLYRVCQRKNSEKGSSILSIQEAGDEFSGMKARSYLYMNKKYRLNFSHEYVELLKTIDRLHEPFPFEIRRAKKIMEDMKIENIFVTKS
jgi:hypothetical protein